MSMQRCAIMSITKTALSWQGRLVCSRCIVRYCSGCRFPHRLQGYHRVCQVLRTAVSETSNVLVSVRVDAIGDTIDARTLSTETAGSYKDFEVRDGAILFLDGFEEWQEMGVI